MLESGRRRAGSSRVAATIASTLAMGLALVLTFVFLLRTTSGAEVLPQDQGPIGASVESGDFDSLPFGKLIEESVGEEASEKSESKDLEVAALSTVELDALAQVGRLVGEWERPSANRARALLGVIGARGPPVG